jgi:hypothetical protein
MTPSMTMTAAWLFAAETVVGVAVVVVAGPLACANKLPAAMIIATTLTSTVVIPPVRIIIANSTMKFAGRNVTALITPRAFSSL